MAEPWDAGNCCYQKHEKKSTCRSGFTVSCLKNKHEFVSASNHVRWLHKNSAKDGSKLAGQHLGTLEIGKEGSAIVVT